MKNNKSKPPTDAQGALDATTAEAARLEGKRAELTDRIAAVASRADEAEEAAANLIYRRDVDGDTTVEGALEEAEASADRARREHRQLERARRQVDETLARLRGEQAVLRQAVARGKIGHLTAEAEAFAAKIDAGLALLSEGRSGLRQVRIAQAEIAAGVLPEAETSRFHHLRTIDRKITWEMGSLGIIQRPLSGRYTAELTCEQLEREVQRGGAPALVDDDDEPADRPVIDAAELAEVLVAEPRSVAQH